MVILRQKIYARRDYEGLSDKQKEKLRFERDWLAMKLKKERKKINKDYNKKFRHFFAWPIVENNPFYKDTESRNFRYKDALDSSKINADLIKDKIKLEQYDYT